MKDSLQTVMKDSPPSLSRRRRLDLYHVRNCTTTTIPFDLIIEILSLLPAKSLLRFQSVSKLWFSTIRSKTFVDSFLTRSKTRPRLLFTFYLKNSRENFIFSAPEHDNNDDKSSSVVARYDMAISDPHGSVICGSVNGFVCFRGVSCFRGVDCNTIYVYNPTTRQIVKLPVVTLNGEYMDARFGYDPVEDQYKVLCVMMFDDSESQDIQLEHFVCTLSSSQRQEWRKIENPTGDNYQCAFFGQICIDGALYYGVGHSRIVRFDLRSEKIDIIKTPKKSHISTAYQSTLINYKGRLGGVDYSCTENLMTLWVLEDAEREEWSSMKCALPPQWEDLLGGYQVSKGVIHTGELMVFNPWLESSMPFYVCYYDFNKKSTREVEIRGIKDCDFRRFHWIDEMLCYPGHVENIRFV